jgi:hypothetical protein
MFCIVEFSLILLLILNFSIWGLRRSIDSNWRVFSFIWLILIPFYRVFFLFIYLLVFLQIKVMFGLRFIKTALRIETFSLRSRQSVFNLNVDRAVRVCFCFFSIQRIKGFLDGSRDFFSFFNLRKTLSDQLWRNNYEKIILDNVLFTWGFDRS